MYTKIIRPQVSGGEWESIKGSEVVAQLKSGFYPLCQMRQEGKHEANALLFANSKAAHEYLAKQWEKWQKDYEEQRNFYFGTTPHMQYCEAQMLDLQSILEPAGYVFE